MNEEFIEGIDNIGLPIVEPKKKKEYAPLQPLAKTPLQSALDKLEFVKDKEDPLNAELEESVNVVRKAAQKEVLTDLKRLGNSILENSPTLLAIDRAWQEVAAYRKDLDEGFTFTEQGFIDVDSVKQTKYAKWADQFEGKSAQRAKVLQLQIDQALAREKLNEDLGLAGHIGYGIAGFSVAFTLDPVAKFFAASKALGSVGKFAKPIAEMGLLETAIQTGRFATDPTKTAGERALEGSINTLGFALLHGVIEGVRATPAGVKKLLKRLDKNPNDTAKIISEQTNEPFIKGFEKPLEPSAQATEGALAEHEFDIGEATKLKSAGTARERIIEVLKGGDTSLALALSKSRKVRDTAMKLVPLEEGVRGDLLGLGRETPASIAIRNLKDDQIKIFEATVEKYLKQSGMERIPFEVELAKAMHKDGRSEIPAVTEAAKILRDRIFDANWQRANEAGVPVGKLEFREGESYFPRVWELDPITKDPEGAAAAIELGGQRREMSVRAEYADFAQRRKTLQTIGKQSISAKKAETNAQIQSLTKDLNNEKRLLKKLEKDLQKAETNIQKAEIKKLNKELAAERRTIKKIEEDLQKAESKRLEREAILEEQSMESQKATAKEEIKKLNKELKSERRLVNRLEKDLQRAERHAEIAVENRELIDIRDNLSKRVEELNETIAVKELGLKVFEKLATDKAKFFKKEIDEVLGVLTKEEVKWQRRLKESAWKEGNGKKIVRDMLDDKLSVDGYMRTGTGIRRQRVLDFVPHEAAEPFINLDLEYLTRRHIDMMSREIVLAEKFGEYFTDIRESSFAEIIKSQLEAAGKEAGWDFKKTSKITAKQLDDLNALLQMVRGTFRKSASESAALLKGERILNGYMHMTKMGLGGITQSVDFAMAIREIGMLRFLGEAFVQSIQGLGGFMRKVVGKERQPELLKDLLNIFHEETARFAGDLQQQAFQRGSKNIVVRGAEYTYDLFQTVTGMRAIDKGVYNFHAKAIYNYIQRILRRGRFSKAEIEFLSRHGISATEAQALSNVAKGGRRTSMGWIANYTFEQWETIRSAVRIGAEGLSLNQKDYIVPKSFQKSMVLRIVSKYKSYLFMLNRRVLISGINNKNMKYLWTMGALFAAEAMAKAIKGIVGSKGTPETQDMLKEGLKGSGVFGILAPGVDVIDGMTNGRGFEENVSRNIPALGVVADLAIVANAYANPKRRNKPFSAKEMRAIKRLTPFNNIIGLSRVWNDAIGDRKPI